MTDDDFNVRFATRFTTDGGKEFLKPSPGGEWELFMKIGMEDAVSTTPRGFDKSGEILYILDSRGRNTSALVAIDLETDERTVIAEDPLADLSDFMVHPTERHVQAVAFTYQRKQWQFLDTALAEDFAYLKTLDDGEIRIVSRSLDDSSWIVAYVSDNGPVRYYRYDGKALFLFTNNEALTALPLASMHPVVIRSRDGLDMVGYLTLPVWTDTDGNAGPDKPLPVVMLVHGGPWARDWWGYHPVHQLLANRGYAVLSVNFRGSTGFGKELVNAGNLEWGGKMHDDLVDAVSWAIEEGVADADRVAIMGSSYGGYATLVGLTFTPETFACGVDLRGEVTSIGV